MLLQMALHLGLREAFAERVCVRFLRLRDYVCTSAGRMDRGDGERCSGRQTLTAALSNY